MAEKRSSAGAWAALVCALLAAVGGAALHVLSPEFLPLRHTLSQYANGDFAYVFSAAFAVFGLALGALAYSLVVELPSAAGARFGAFLLILAAFSFLFAAFFPADPGDAAETVTGQVHAWSLRSGVFVALLGGLLASIRLRPYAGWLGWAALALNVGAITANFVFRRAALGENGLEQRALFGLLAIWVVVTAIAGMRAKTHPD
jgi:hypothetical protein